jgi:hypothetical protein
VQIADDGNSLTCLTSAHAAGPVNVVLDNGVDDPATTTLTNGYEYISPNIDTVSPSSGPESGGDSVTITGQYFGGTPPPADGTTLQSYDACGSPQAFTAPSSSAYRLEAWGAGSGKAARGNGGYSAGEVSLNAGEYIKLYS